MVRQARIVVPGAAHHITQPGNYRQDVFFTDDDRRVYLTFLRQSARLHGVSVSAYCLMTNHVHLWFEGMPPVRWKATLAVISEGDAAVEHLRLHTRTGRPLGSDTPLSKVESYLRRRVRSAPRGRPHGSKERVRRKRR